MGDLESSLSGVKPVAEGAVSTAERLATLMFAPVVPLATAGSSLSAPVEANALGVGCVERAPTEAADAILSQELVGLADVGARHGLAEELANRLQLVACRAIPGNARERDGGAKREQKTVFR